jgi:NADPH-dependent F420 reductase
MSEVTTSVPGETAVTDGVTVGVLGGTGPQGRGLGRRLAASGLKVLLGSRSADRARDAAEPMQAEGLPVSGASNEDVAAQADLVIVAVPYEGHRDLLASLAGPLAGKIVVDCVNPMGKDDKGMHALPVAEGRAAQEAAAVLPDSRVVAAFHHVSAVLLEDPQVDSFDLDVLVLGDDREATDLVQALAARIPGMRGIYAGKLRNSGQVEALTVNLIAINIRYKAHAGIRVTDV